MGRVRTPLELVPIDFCGGNCVVIGLGHSVSFSTEFKKVYSSLYNTAQGYYGLFCFEPYLLPGRRVRRSLLQYIM